MRVMPFTEVPLTGTSEGTMALVPRVSPEKRFDGIYEAAN